VATAGWEGEQQMEEISVTGDLTVKRICASWREENISWELQPMS